MQTVEGRLQYDRERGVVYFFADRAGDCLLRIEGVPPVPKGHQIDIHLVDKGNEHHHADPKHPFIDGAICAVKLKA